MCCAKNATGKKKTKDAQSCLYSRTLAIWDPRFLERFGKNCGMIWGQPKYGANEVRLRQLPEGIPTPVSLQSLCNGINSFKDEKPISL